MGQLYAKPRTVDVVYIDMDTCEFTFPIDDIKKPYIRKLVDRLNSYKIRHYIMHHGSANITMTLYVDTEKTFYALMKSVGIPFTLNRIVKNK